AVAVTGVLERWQPVRIRPPQPDAAVVEARDDAFAAPVEFRLPRSTAVGRLQNHATVTSRHIPQSYRSVDRCSDEAPARAVEVAGDDPVGMPAEHFRRTTGQPVDQFDVAAGRRRDPSSIRRGDYDAGRSRTRAVDLGAAAAVEPPHLYDAVRPGGHQLV